MNWLLPEHIADALPAEAARIERLRRLLLDHFQVRGYEFVMPPLLEYLESLLTGAGHDLKLRTFKLVDQLSGRTLGIRADITPQVARIDAHLLNQQGVTRLCYCGSVLHTLPATISAGREPLQLGAELYGYAGIAADIEMIRLMASSLQAVKLDISRIDLSHVGIVRALVAEAALPEDSESQVLSLLQAKDVPGLAEMCSAVPSPLREALLALPSLYGGVEVLEKARAVLPNLSGITEALDCLAHLADKTRDLPLSIDLADLRGYHYHNGVVFAAYCQGYPGAIAQGGRYDGAGKAFGRARPATGFSLDLRELVQLLPVPKPRYGILVPAASDDALLAAHVAALRNQGEIVIEQLPGEENGEGTLCDRKLSLVGSQWIIEALQVD